MIIDVALVDGDQRDVDVASAELNRKTLATLRPEIQRPKFDLAKLAPGIVHLGLGGFHRAHMARLTHSLMDIDPEALSFGIIGAGLLPADRRMLDALDPQDGLYTLVERDGSRETVTAIGSLCGVIFAGEDPEALLEAIGRASVRIVSATVTENGYCLSPATKRLDPCHPLIRHDLEAPQRPKTAIGMIVETLRRRMIAGTPAYTVLSCDNIQHNGNVVKSAVVDFAARRDPALSEWIEKHARFPNSMVDRITPLTTDQDRAELTVRHGVKDRWPVFCETFIQWVVEDDFACGRPNWEKVGVQFVKDVAPYEFMKLRLLNTSHLAISGLGRLMGHHFIHETMGDADVASYMQALMDRETGPTLLEVPGVDIAQYKATLISRFANPTIRDTVDRVNTDAPLNILVDPIRERVRQGKAVDLLALALAAWMRRVAGTDEGGQVMAIKHPMAEEIRKKAVEGGIDPKPLLGLTHLFGDLGEHPEFTATLGAWLASLSSMGAAATLAQARRSLAF